MKPEETGDQFVTRKKYIPGAGKRPPELQRSRCPSCGAWRYSTSVCQPCDGCQALAREAAPPS